MSAAVSLDKPQVAGEPQPVRSPSGTGSRRMETAILLAAGLGFGVWLASGAFRWQGYPVDHAWGRLVAGVLGILALTVLAAVGRLAIGQETGGFGTVIIALIGWTVSRITLASILPLISDEAYHWMWAKHLDLGYFDHPGMVAWMGRLFAPLHGEAAVVARLSPICLSAGIVLLVYALARMLTGSTRMAVRSTLVLMLIPTFHLGFMLLIPSVSVNFFWLLALIFTWRASQHNRLADWLLAGLACGGSFNSNFTTFLLPTCIFAYLLATPQTRRLLRTPGPYLALLASLAAFIPTLIWNAQHEWVTILWNLYQRYDRTQFRPDGLYVYLGELLAFLSPLLVAVMVWTGAKATRTGWRQKDQVTIFLAIMGFGPLLAWLGISCTKFIVAYYAAPAFAPLLILCTRYCTSEPEHVASPSAERWYRRASNLTCVQTMILAAGILSLAFIPPDLAASYLVPALPRTGSMWMADLFGWPALGRYLDSFDVKMNAQSRLVAIGPTYAQASLAMYHSKNVEMAYALDAGTGRYGQEFVFWAPLDKMPIGCDAIVFRPGMPSDPERMRKMLLQHFSRVEQPDFDAHPRLKHFLIFRAYGYKGDLDSERRVARKAK